MSFSPQLFLSNIAGKDGLAKPCRYEVILPIPKYISDFVSQSVFEKLYNLPNALIGDITGALSGETAGQSSNPSISRYLGMQCESAELPGKSLITYEAQTYGPSYKIPYMSQYGDTNLTFLCTNEFYERKLFERWIEAINPTDTNNLRFPKGNTTRYMTTIKIVQYDDFIKQIFAVELIDAFPIAIASQPLAWSEEGFHRLSISFAYHRYRVIYDGKYDLAAAALELFGTKMAPWAESIRNKINEPSGRLFNVINTL